MYNKCNQWLGGWRVSLPDILGGFETRQKKIFHIFGTREKIRNFFSKKYRYLSEKSAIFRRFFYFRFFHPKIFSSTAENRFFTEKSVEKTDFFVYDDMREMLSFREASSYTWKRVGLIEMGISPLWSRIKKDRANSTNF